MKSHFFDPHRPYQNELAVLPLALRLCKQPAFTWRPLRSAVTVRNPFDFHVRGYLSAPMEFSNLSHESAQQSRKWLITTSLVVYSYRARPRHVGSPELSSGMPSANIKVTEDDNEDTYLASFYCG